MTSLSDWALYKCSNLSKAVFAEGSKLASVGMNAFDNCSSLASVEFPSGVTSISWNAFAHCGSLKDLYLPDGVAWIGGGSGYDFSKESTVTLSVARGTYAERWAKDHNVRYTSREPEETITVSSGSSSATSVDDQNKVSEKLVAKSDRTDVTMEGYDPSDSNAIDKGGKASGEKAGVENKQGNEQEVAPNQGRCGEAVTWSLDESGNLIIDGNGKMYDYSDDRPAPWAELSKRIVSIHIGPKVETVGAYAFAGLDKVKAVAFDDGSELTEIHDFAFSGCKTLREIELPKKVAKIGQGAFERCENLEIVGLPESVTSIGEVLVEQESKQPTAGQASVDAFAGSPLVKVEAEKVFARSQFPSWYNASTPSTLFNRGDGVEA